MLMNSMSNSNPAKTSLYTFVIDCVANNTNHVILWFIKGAVTCTPGNESCTIARRNVALHNKHGVGVGVVQDVINGHPLPPAINIHVGGM